MRQELRALRLHSVRAKHWQKSFSEPGNADLEKPWSSCACRTGDKGLAGMLFRCKHGSAAQPLLACCTPGIPSWGIDRASLKPVADLVAWWCCSLLMKSCLPGIASVALLHCMSDCLAELLVADAGEAEPLAAEGMPDWSLADALLPANPRCASCRWLLLLLADCSAGWRRMTGTAPCRPAEMGQAPAAGSPLALPLSADNVRPGSPAPALPTCCPWAFKVQASMDL